MIRSRNQNSFLAVATLGVYLGLILAGATPLVLAQAATSKQFNVKDEIVTQEDLDSDPQVPVAQKALDAYLSDTETFIASLSELASSREVLDGETVFEKSFDHGCGGIAYTYGSDAKSSGNPNLEKRFSLFAEHLSHNADFVPCTSRPENRDAGGRRSIWARIGLDQKYFWIELQSLHHASGEAQLFADALEKVAAFKRSAVKSAVRAQLLEHAKFSAHNDFVGLAIILPRGSLDELLASNAK